MNRPWSRPAAALAAAVMLAGCDWRNSMTLAKPPATIAAPTLRPFADGVHWALERDLVFVYPGWPEIRVPAGFVTDLASIPAAAQSLRSRVGTYSRAAILHDWLYWTGVCSRSQADRIMFHAMQTSGSSGDVARQVYLAVSRFGNGAYAGNAAERERGLPRVVPIAKLDQLDDHDWPSVRTALGKVEPPSKPDPAPAYCALGGPADPPGKR